MNPTPRSSRLGVVPSAPLLTLDTLWFQVAGTICNLSCTHCFIACRPDNHSHPMLSFEDFERHLWDAARLGVKEYYFTGGEPFLHRALLEMLRRTLEKGPATVLSNGLLIRPAVAEALGEISRTAEYSLDIRISLDGLEPAANDAIRGAGTFDRVIEGLQGLARVGLNPILTVTEACPGAGTVVGRKRFFDLLRQIGLTRPRLKILPLLRPGAESQRQRAYTAWENLAGVVLDRRALEALQCTSARMVTARGVYVCPILIDSPEARLGDRLEDGLAPFPLQQGACYTCHVEGLSCRT